MQIISLVCKHIELYYVFKNSTPLFNQTGISCLCISLLPKCTDCVQHAQYHAQPCAYQENCSRATECGEGQQAPPPPPQS